MTVPGVYNKTLLIELVKARPAVWNRTTDDYSDKNLKKECWIEICRAMKKNYDDLSKSDQEIYYRCMIKLWTHTRDSWARTLKTNRKAKKTGSVPRLYRYHKQLLFLSKTKNSRFVVDSDESEQEEEQEEEITTAGCESDAAAVSDNDSNLDFKGDIDLSAINNEQTIQIDDTMNRQNMSLPDDEMIAKMEAFLNAHADLMKHQTVTQEDRHVKNQSYAQEERYVKNESVIQEDRHFAFFKSIHPSLTSLNDDQTLEFQSGVLNLLRSIKSAGRLNNFASNQPNPSRGYYSQPEAPVVKQQPEDVPEAAQISSSSVGSSRAQPRVPRILLDPLTID